MPTPQTGNYRCEAKMSDDSTGVLFASCHGTGLGAALSIASMPAAT